MNMRMKKIGLCALMFSLLLVVLTVGVGATAPASADALTIQVQDAEGEKGAEFVVPVYVESNPGFSYLRLTVEHGQGLELVDVENGEVMGDLDHGVNLLWSADQQTTKTGVLVYLHFRAAEAGNYSVKVIVRECYNDAFDDVPTETATGEATVVNCLHENVTIQNPVNPTCTADGCTYGEVCADCGEVLVVSETIEAEGHDHEAVITAPTCTERGYTTHTCHCGDSYVDSYTDTLDHTPGSWIVDVQPSAGVEGSRHKECVDCHTVLTTETLPALPVETEPAPETEPETEPTPETKPAPETKPEPETNKPETNAPDTDTESGDETKAPAAQPTGCAMIVRIPLFLLLMGILPVAALIRKKD